MRSRKGQGIVEYALILVLAVVVVIVAYLAEYLSGDLLAGDETEAVRLIKPSEIPWDDLAFQSTIDALKDYCHLKNVRH